MARITATLLFRLALFGEWLGDALNWLAVRIYDLADKAAFAAAEIRVTEADRAGK